MNIILFILCIILSILIILLYFRIFKIQEDISKLKKASVYHELEIKRLKKQIVENNNETS